MKEKGNISINTENIFPIIKKFLYSDQDIFLRELISNAAGNSSPDPPSHTFKEKRRKLFFECWRTNRKKLYPFLKT